MEASGARNTARVVCKRPHLANGLPGHLHPGGQELGVKSPVRALRRGRQLLKEGRALSAGEKRGDSAVERGKEPEESRVVQPTGRRRTARKGRDERSGAIAKILEERFQRPGTGYGEKREITMQRPTKTSQQRTPGAEMAHLRELQPHADSRRGSLEQTHTVSSQTKAIWNSEIAWESAAWQTQAVRGTGRAGERFCLEASACCSRSSRSLSRT